jgi:hypothetical protein
MNSVSKRAPFFSVLAVSIRTKQDDQRLYFFIIIADKDNSKAINQLGCLFAYGFAQHVNVFFTIASRVCCILLGKVGH